MNPGKRGTIIKWFDEKGYGFIKPVTGESQLFFHIRSIRNLSRRDLLGVRVTYQETTGKDGRPAADDVYLAIESPSAFHQAPRVRASASNRSGASLAWIVTLSFIAATTVGAASGHLPVYTPIAYVVMSVFTYLMYADDKQNAATGRWRTSESTLHWLELLCGWPGALVAQWSLRHKNRKQGYQGWFWIIVLINIGLLGKLSMDWKTYYPDSQPLRLLQRYERQSPAPSNLVIEFVDKP